ncbi:hypothetical protein [Lentibacillus sp. Marseille-P4043]|uniref:hypothetical protein n=1 Tax=Lentibacillus sp. Marseille-P4043 TaxID=2040293 RepID=UPI00131A50B5|nr:hypothetical protein [Lentibacillus sp. Marseille-P4043]
MNEETSTREREHRPVCGNINPRTKTSTQKREHPPEGSKNTFLYKTSIRKEPLTTM